MIDRIYEDLETEINIIDELIAYGTLEYEEARRSLEYARKIRSASERLILMLSSYVAGIEERRVTSRTETEIIAEEVEYSIKEKIEGMSASELIILAMAYSPFATIETKEEAERIKAEYGLSEEEARIIVKSLRGER